MININDTFDNIIVKLVPYNYYDDTIIDSFKIHLKEDGDFEEYTLTSLDDTQLDMHSMPCSNLSFSIFLRKTNEFVGIISLTPINDSEFNEFDEKEVKASVSYYILKKYRGNGYCQEALMLLAHLAFNDYLKVELTKDGKHAFGFTTANISMISAFTSCSNDASKTVLTNSLFKKMGRINKFKKINNRFIDVDYYELSRDKFLRREEKINKIVDKIRSLNLPIIDLTEKEDK